MKTQEMSLRRASGHRSRVPVNSPLPAHHEERRGISPAALMLRRVSGLIGQAYEDAPLAVRTQLLEKLLRPMSPFALISVAGGVFARIRGRNAEWQGFQLRGEDIADVDGREVAALAARAQQVHGDAVDGLARVMAACPALAATGAGSALIALIDQRSRM